MVESTIGDRLAAICGTAHVDVGDAVSDDLCHDEALGLDPVRPVAVVRPATTDEVAAIVSAAVHLGVPITARGSGTGLSGASIPVAGGIVVSFERMAAILEIDIANQVAVVEPGVTLAALDAALAPLGLVYPVFPGEQSASLGGNVSTNAGGMRAVKYGVTRHHVLGLEAVLGTGEVISTGGKFVKATSGYDLTQLVIGSEGTLALVTRALLRLHPRPEHQTTVLAPFATMDLVAGAVPPVVASGVGPLLVEYIDMISMAGITANAGIDLGIPEDVRAAALAYLVIVLEDHHRHRLEEDTESLALQLAELGALDVYVLPDHAGQQLDLGTRARLLGVQGGRRRRHHRRGGAPGLHPDLPGRRGRSGRGHRVAGGRMRTRGRRQRAPVGIPARAGRASPLIHDILAAGVAHGGAVSGEHGIGTAKLASFTDLEDPVKLDLMRRIKDAFDPAGILNPGKVLAVPRPEGARP